MKRNESFNGPISFRLAYSDDTDSLAEVICLLM